jgi:FtsP/CotA-like multicopper oxidase with cupredoxin domain
MAGALIVEGLLDPYPTLRDVKERILLLKDIQLEKGKVVQRSIVVGTTRTINGQMNPTLALHPGETQLWRIGNLSANLYYRLRLDGHRFYPVARDGNRFTRIVPTDGLFIPPGGRMEVLVRAGTPGVYPLRTLAMNTGPAGNKYPAAVLATARVEGDTVAPHAIPTTLLPVVDLRGKVTGRRTVVFSETPDGDVEMIDGKTFDPARIDTRVQLGAVEEWTVRNESDELHDFHIHQGGFQLVEINGKPQPLDAYYDTVNLPIRGEIKIIIPFTDSVTAGKFVYHCHLLAHEDKGMMATIEVTPATSRSAR